MRFTDGVLFVVVFFFFVFLSIFCCLCFLFPVIRKQKNPPSSDAFLFYLFFPLWLNLYMSHLNFWWVVSIIARFDTICCLVSDLQSQIWKIVLLQAEVVRLKSRSGALHCGYTRVDVFSLFFFFETERLFVFIIFLIFV